MTSYTSGGVGTPKIRSNATIGQNTDGDEVQPYERLIALSGS